MRQQIASSPGASVNPVANGSSFTERYRPILAMVAVLLFTWTPYFYLRYAMPGVYSPFKSAYEAYRLDLGNPIAKETKITQTSEVKHKNAWVFWTKENNAFYRLPIGGGIDGSTWSEIHYPNPPAGENWRDEKYTGTLIRVPSGSPPTGGIAFAWYNDPKEWEWIGGMESHCGFTETPTFIQEFQHGKILGVVRSEQGNAQVIVLLDSGSVSFKPTAEKAPNCDP